jgi:Fe2+ transport system protein FeoA
LNLKTVFTSATLETAMKLAEIGIGQVVTITDVGGERAFRRRLMELGLVPGTRIELLRVAPLGDPVEFLVRGCSLSIRRAEAAHVAVRANAPVGAEASERALEPAFVPGSVPAIAVSSVVRGGE